jgi:hypothetical protein
MFSSRRAHSFRRSPLSRVRDRRCPRFHPCRWGEARLDGARGELTARVHRQFVQHILEMVCRGFLRDHKRLANPAIRQAACRQLRDLAFTGRELVDASRRAYASRPSAPRRRGQDALDHDVNTAASS